MSFGAIDPAELRRRLDAGEELQVVDVREHEELAICALEGAVHLPLGELPARVGELDAGRTTVCVCHHGMRSASAASFLVARGFADVLNLTGGIDRWAAEVQPDMARY